MDPILDLPPIPRPTTAAERRAAALGAGSTDPRALALMLAGDPGLRETGQNLEATGLRRQQMAEEESRQRFEQEMAGTKELRERAHLRLLEEQIRQGRYIVGKDLADRPFLIDTKTGRPVALPPLGPKQPPQTPQTGTPPAFAGATAGAVGRQARPGDALRGPPSPSASLPGAPALPTRRAAPGGAPAAPEVVPETGLREPSDEELVAAHLRKKLPQKVQDQLSAAEELIPVVRRAEEMVRARPQAFGFGKNVAGVPLVGGLLSQAQQAYRDPLDTEARAWVFEHAVQKIHEFAGSQQTPTEITRIREFEPGENLPAPQVLALLRKARQQAQMQLRQRYTQYMPLLSAPRALTEETVRLRAPTGEERDVPEDQADQLIRRGATRVR